MTSEILIMNNNSIVMAADSAVTIDDRKTYNGVNKLFKLSNDPPMGIMIFGKANFVSIPMETIIKEYRRKRNFKELENIMEIKKDFIEYLSELPYSTDFLEIEKELDVFKRHLLDNLNELSKKELDGKIKSLRDVEIFSFIKGHGVNKKFEDIYRELSEKEMELSIDTLKKWFSEKYSYSSTGVVIAGFSHDEFFPSYLSFNLIAKNGNDVTIRDSDIEINYNGNIIVPFAQKDVITNFMTGIDIDLERVIINYFSKYIISYIERLIINLKSYENIQEKDLNLILNENIHNKEINEIIGEFLENINTVKKNMYYPILESIGILPNNQLVELAESMIYITSLKRKISFDLESVGGDIDVAIISKGDGFVWGKKK